MLTFSLHRLLCFFQLNTTAGNHKSLTIRTHDGSRAHAHQPSLPTDAPAAHPLWLSFMSSFFRSCIDSSNIRDLRADLDHANRSEQDLQEQLQQGQRTTGPIE